MSPIMSILIFLHSLLASIITSSKSFSSQLGGARTLNNIPIGVAPSVTTSLQDIFTDNLPMPQLVPVIGSIDRTTKSSFKSTTAVSIPISDFFLKLLLYNLKYV